MEILYGVIGFGVGILLSGLLMGWVLRGMEDNHRDELRAFRIDWVQMRERITELEGKKR